MLKVLVESSLLSFKIKKLESQITLLQQQIQEQGTEDDLDILLNAVYFYAQDCFIANLKRI